MPKYVLVDEVNHVPKSATHTFCEKEIALGVPTWHRRLMPDDPKPMCETCFEAITDVPIRIGYWVEVIE